MDFDKFVNIRIHQIFQKADPGRKCKWAMQMDFDICECIRIRQIITGTDSIGQFHSLNFVKIRIHQIIT